MPFGFGRRRKEASREQYQMSPVACAEGFPAESARDHVAVIMEEIETALRRKRQFRSCLARLLKKDPS